MHYKFPFFGAGEATYFEFIGLNIRFKIAPTSKQVAAIIEVLPMEYGASADDFEGKWCNLYSEFGYGHIEIAIPNIENFNAEIRASVLEVNNICPIQFVYRSEDQEAAGTKYNDWHYQSEKQLSTIVKEVEAELPLLPLAIVVNLKLYFEEILTLYEMDTALLGLEVWNPMKLLYKQLKEGKLEEVENSIQKFTSSEIDLWISYIKKSDAVIDLYPLVNSSTNAYLQERIICNPPIFTEILYKIKEENNPLLLEKFKSAFTNAEDSDYLFNYGFTTRSKYSPSKIVEIIDFFLSVTAPNYQEHLDSSAWVNAIYFLIPSNGNGIPIDKERYLKIVKHSLPYAPNNPSIYWNAYCLYAAIGEIEKAFDCIENTVKHKLNAKSLRHLIRELKTDDGEASILRADARFEDFYSSFLKNAKVLLIK